MRISLALLWLAAVQGAIAAPLACPTTGTYQTLLNSNASGGCTISEGGATLLFENFTFSPSGAGTPAASAMSYTLDNPGVGSAGQPIFGFELNPGLTVTGTSANPTPSQSLILSYLVVPTGTAINSVDLLENATASGGAVGQVSEGLQFCIASDPNNTSGTCRVFANPVAVSTSTGLQDHVTFGAWTSMTVSEQITASSGGVGSTATISQVRDAVDLNTTAPEPQAYGLVSVGLLAFGYFARRRRP